MEPVTVDEAQLREEYGEPLSKLLTMGQPRSSTRYSLHGPRDEHATLLIRMATDMRLHRAGTDSPLVWAPVHAWRMLGILGAVEAVGPLIGLFRLVDDPGDDWIDSDLPDALARIGPSCIFPVMAYLADETKGLYSRITACSTLSKVGEHHPDCRHECVAILSAQLEKYNEQDDGLNGFLISALIDLEAVEAAPLMEQAFADKRVDLMIIGDWEDAQVELGLIEQRTTRPRQPIRMSGTPQSNKQSAQPRTTKKANKRAEKKARKKNRRN